MNFQLVSEFENKIANFFGSNYAVATDSCTHALELAMRYSPSDFYTCPAHTYISVPFTFQKLGVNWNFKKTLWKDYYYISSNIIDAAVYWKNNSYISNTFMCISFQFKKHLSLGRGGAILLQNEKDYINLKKMSYDGRNPGIPWAEQNINTIGYHYYMTPEVAKLGIKKFPQAAKTNPKKWSDKDYPNLTEMEIFK